MLKKIFKACKNPKLIIKYLLNNRIFRLLPDDTYLSIKYKVVTGKKLTLKNPKSFNEKIQWLKLHDRKPEYTQMVDKYEMRKYISTIIGEEYLIPLLGVYDSFEEIDFEALPNQFVLKPNHTSGDVFLCKDKSKINYAELKQKVNRWLKENYFWIHREWPYKNIKPRIVCEKFMVDKSGNGLTDYKVMCFNGQIKCTFVCLNRASQSGLNIDIYDADWNPMPFERPLHPNSGSIISKPKNFDKMLEISKKLSKSMAFVRVDFYEVNGKLYIGELTLYPGSGLEPFSPDSYDNILGSWLALPNRNM